ncbi:MAG: histidinol-phosphate transaminase [Legionella sp.]|nr:histidinol-phosphate transaminase [Legionella sp.]
MPIDFQKMPHAGIRSLIPYKPGKSIEELAKEQGITNIIKLASNENPLGCSPMALAALKQMASQLIATYPSPLNHTLMPKLASKLGISTDKLFLSNGSDFICGLLLNCFALHSNKHMLTHEYAFSTYAIQAKSLNIPTHTVAIHPNWEVDVEGLIQACNSQTALLFLANPNNPTGLLISQAKIKYLLENIPVSTLLVLDEAYYEYAASLLACNSIDWLSEHPNLIITRTFSKLYGMAGLRLGYAIANPEIIALLLKLQLPFLVNQAALTAAEAALDDENFVKSTLKNNELGRIQLCEALDKLHLDYIPSVCNFISFNCNEDGKALYNFLLTQGIIVRPLHPYRMAEYIRVTIGTPEQNKRFIKSLFQYYNYIS